MSYLNGNGPRKWGPRRHREIDSEASRPPWIQRAPRVGVIGWIILLVLGLYLIRLWQLQFLEALQRNGWESEAPPGSRFALLSAGSPVRRCTSKDPGPLGLDLYSGETGQRFLSR